MILVGGVGQLWQGDLDIGRRAAERLAEILTGPGVEVEDLYYGAVAVAQRLEELRPHALVLVGATARPGRQPGTVEARKVVASDPDLRSLQGAVADAVTGYVGIDLLIDVATALQALPPVTVVVEVEPAATAPGDHLSPAGAAALDVAVTSVQAAVSTLERFRHPATVPAMPET